MASEITPTPTSGQWWRLNSWLVIWLRLLPDAAELRCSISRLTNCSVGKQSQVALHPRLSGKNDSCHKSNQWACRLAAVISVTAKGIFVGYGLHPENIPSRTRGQDQSCSFGHENAQECHRMKPIVHPSMCAQ